MPKQFTRKNGFKNMKFIMSWESLVVSVVMDTQYIFALLAAVVLQMFCTSVQLSIVPPIVFFQSYFFHFMLLFHLIIGAGFCLVVFLLSPNEHPVTLQVHFSLHFISSPSCLLILLFSFFFSCLPCSWELKGHNSSGQARSFPGHRHCLLCGHLLKTQVSVVQ